MATSTYSLAEIIKMQGDMGSRPWRLVDEIYWFTPEKAFETCDCSQREHHDQVQVLLPAKLTKCGLRSPGSSHPTGPSYSGIAGSIRCDGLLRATPSKVTRSGTQTRTTLGLSSKTVAWGRA